MWSRNLSIFWLCAIAHTGHAYPWAMSNDVEQIERVKREIEAAGINPEDFLDKRQITTIPNPNPPFDAKLQYVSNTGKHAFVPPSGNDQRGPCIGLNAAANHGYIPHNGIGTISQIANAVTEAFGMADDLAILLAVYGAVFDGDLTKYSVGGPYPTVTAGPLLGQPRGLSGSHNRYEGDASPTRGDLYQYGNTYVSQMRFFKALWEKGMANGNTIDIDLLTEFRSERFNQSINENPYFFNAPFSGVLALPGAWGFVYRFLANHTEEHPAGILTLENLKTWWSVTGDYPDFKFVAGHERIPDNFYKRHPSDYYSIPDIAYDIATMALKHNEFASVGGNVGKPNSFVGLNPGGITEGVFNWDNILVGNNLTCFALSFSIREAPDLLAGLFTDTNAAVDILGAAVTKATNALGCPELNNIDQTQFAKFPGYAKLKKDGTY